MATEVVMPQMGESIAEGTIVRWIKKVGDAIDKDEPLFEISTDKVDAEIPSPGAGVLLEIKVKEGETVPVNSVVAVIGAAHEGTGTTGTKSSTDTSGTFGSEGSEGSKSSEGPDGSSGSDQAPPNQVQKAPDVPVEPPEPVVPSSSRESRLRELSSPVVRNIAAQHGVDISQLRGSGISGRVTKQDILAF